MERTKQMCTICKEICESDYSEYAAYSFHDKCMICFGCKKNISSKQKVVWHEGHLYCRVSCVKPLPEYLSCSECNAAIEAGDLVRRIGERCVHYLCLVCSVCRVTLSTGVLYKQAKDGKIYCETHARVAEAKRKARTFISKPQKKFLLGIFNKRKYLNPMETAKIATNLGLPIHTVRIWFQNARARNYE